MRLHLAVQPGAAEFTVENQRHDYQADPDSGSGLANLRRCRALLYPGQHAVAAGPAGPRLCARLRLNVPAEAAAVAAADPLATPLPVPATALATQPVPGPCCPAPSFARYDTLRSN